MLPEFSLDVPNHNGQPAEPDGLFFGEADELRPLLSATTNTSRSRGVKRWSGARVAAVIVGILIGAALALIPIAILDESGQRELLDHYVWAFFLAGGLLGAAFFAWLSRPWQTCTFVGRGGLLRVRRRGERVKQDKLRFADAAELRLAQTRHYTNGVYTGTSFDYTWRDAAGARLFRIFGSFREHKRKVPALHNPLHFGQAAEAAWLEHRLPGVLKTVQGGSEVRFPVGKGGYLAVGRGYLELGTKKAPRRLEAADVESVRVHQGYLTIKPKGGGWGSTLRVAFSSIGDGKILLALLERHLGLTVQ